MMNKIDGEWGGDTSEYPEFVTIKKCELKRLYKKIQEYELRLRQCEADYKAALLLISEQKKKKESIGVLK